MFTFFLFVCLFFTFSPIILIRFVEQAFVLALFLPAFLGPPLWVWIQKRVAPSTVHPRDDNAVFSIDIKRGFRLWFWFMLPVIFYVLTGQISCIPNWGYAERGEHPAAYFVLANYRLTACGSHNTTYLATAIFTALLALLALTWIFTSIRSSPKDHAVILANGELFFHVFFYSSMWHCERTVFRRFSFGEISKRAAQPGGSLTTPTVSWGFVSGVSAASRHSGSMTLITSSPEAVT